MLEMAIWFLILRLNIPTRFLWQVVLPHQPAIVMSEATWGFRIFKAHLLFAMFGILADWRLLGFLLMTVGIAGWLMTVLITWWMFRSTYNKPWDKTTTSSWCPSPWQKHGFKHPELDFQLGILFILVVDACTNARYPSHHWLYPYSCWWLFVISCTI